MTDVGFWHQVCRAVELYGSRIPVADLTGLRRSGVAVGSPVDPAADSAVRPVEP